MRAELQLRNGGWLAPSAARGGMRWVALLLAGSFAGHAATVSGPGQAANPGDSLTVSLTLTSGAQPVSGMQFDLVWDAALDVHVTPGTQAGISNKVIYPALLQPHALRCLIVGLNDSTVTDGELVRVVIAVNSAAAPGLSQVKLLNLSATAADGKPALLLGGTIGVQIQSGNTAQPIQADGVLNGASFAAGPICPGEIITLLGSIPAGSPAVLFNGVPATVTYAGLNQVNAIVPFGLDLSNAAQVEIRQPGSSAKTAVAVAAASPAIFTLSASGIGPGAILNQDYSVNSSGNPAAPGSVVMIYGTGFGALNPLPADGQIALALASTTSPVTATIDGIPAQVIYAGAAPQLINGMVQANVVVPAGVPANPAAPISLTINSFTTQPGVTVSIK